MPVNTWPVPILSRNGAVPRSGPPPSFSVGVHGAWGAAATDAAATAAITPTTHRAPSRRIARTEAIRFGRHTTCTSRVELSRTSCEDPRRCSANRRMFSGRHVRDDPAMDDTPILICYDGSANAARAITAAAALLGPRRSVVLDIAAPITPAASLAAIGPLVPGDAFVDLNRAQAGDVARRGAELARSAGFDAEARSAVAAPTWEGVVAVADELNAAAIVI